jgi:DNA polymerase III alpha subunit
MNIIPIFYDHSSKKSILTYWKIKETEPDGPRSIIKLCKENNVDTIYGVSDNFATFIEAYKNCREEKIKFRFGFEVWMCDDAKVHNEESLLNEHKIIIFGKNSASYKDMVRIFSAVHADKDNFYYKARFDFNQLANLWTNNLHLALPFFDSFIAQNATNYGSFIVNQLPTDPIIFREQDTEHPKEKIINRALDSYNADKKFTEVKTKTIFYEKSSHFDEYTVYRCIQNRGASFDEPKMDFFCSPTFSFENYLTLRNS